MIAFLLKLLPLRDWLYALAFGVLIVGGVQFVHHERELGAEHEKTAVKAVAAAAAASAASETERRTAQFKEIAHATEVSASAVVADAASAVAARDALRVQLDAVIRASRVPSNPASAGLGSPVQGGDPIGVLAELLDRADQREGVYAQLADERRVRAAACEASFDALKASGR